MGQFDSVEIRSPDMDGATVATIQRGRGPIEQERFDASGPTVSTEEEIVQLGAGFGIDAGGALYYDTDGADEDEECVVRLIPSTLTLIFDTEG